MNDVRFRRVTQLLSAFCPSKTPLSNTVLPLKTVRIEFNVFLKLDAIILLCFLFFFPRKIEILKFWSQKCTAIEP